MDKVRLLFMPAVDAGNTNAQSLNVREIALRLDDARFDITLWYEAEPDSRLRNHRNIRLLQLPVRRKSWRILREMLGGYDIISYMDYSPASYAFLHLPSMLRGKAKAIYHAEAPATQLMNPSRLLRFLYEGTFSRGDACTGITAYVSRDVNRSSGRTPSHILPVGVDTKLFTPPMQRANLSPVILFAGTVIERKGPQYVVEAAARFPNAIFRIVGAGREGFENHLKKKIADLGLNNVRLDGPKTQLQMVEIMQSSDIFLLPSRLEGIPKVTLEASATGLPCIVFRDYETPSVVDGVTGFQVATLDEMMQALGKLVADRPLRESMGAAAQMHMQNFDWDIVAGIWEKAYLEIAGGHAT
jgi:glycosyltransferase involved in cell wall biosynthesis